MLEEIPILFHMSPKHLPNADFSSSEIPELYQNQNWEYTDESLKEKVVLLRINLY